MGQTPSWCNFTSNQAASLTVTGLEEFHNLKISGNEETMVFWQSAQLPAMSHGISLWVYFPIFPLPSNPCSDYIQIQQKKPYSEQRCLVWEGRKQRKGRHIKEPI